jgi:hypothetical protein
LLIFGLFIWTKRELKLWGYTIIAKPYDYEKISVKELPYAFQRKMVKDLEETHDKLKNDIKSLTYMEKMNWENDFLSRVGALYEEAKSVHAVTLSSISDFWVSENDKVLIEKYLEQQNGKNIKRLFVFESPYDLMRYRLVLDENHNAYGDQGGVFITSIQNYQANILRDICRAEEKYSYNNKDFGIWEFEDTSLDLF